MFWDLPVGRYDQDFSEGGTECKPGWNKKYTKEREGFDLSKPCKFNHAILRNACAI